MKGLAYFFSSLFHPLLVLSYGLFYLLLSNPYAFGSSHWTDQTLLLIKCFIYTFIFPLIGVVMMRMLGLSTSIDLPNKEDRIGPLIIVIVFYVWFLVNIYSNPDLPLLFIQFVLGATIAICLSFFINVFIKISLHAVGLGGAIGLIGIGGYIYQTEYITLGSYHIHYFVVLLILVLFTGFICTLRLVAHAHILKEIYGGLLVGLSAQFIAMRFLV
jgi:hypothetical protein